VTPGCACAHSVGAVDEFAYFMIRVRRETGKGAEDVPLSGVIERLASGEKSTFDGSEALIRLVRAWSLPTSPMQEGSTDVGSTRE